RARAQALCRARPALGREAGLDRGDGLHLDQELLLNEAIDDEQRVRRIGAVGKKRRELALAPGHEARDVLRAHEVGRELYDVGPSGARRFQRLADLREDAAALRIEIAARREHAGDEEELRRLDAREVRVLAEGFAQRADVVDLDLGHQRFLRSWRHCTSLRPAWRLRRRPAMKSTSESRLR